MPDIPKTRVGIGKEDTLEASPSPSSDGSDGAAGSAETMPAPAGGGLAAPSELPLVEPGSYQVGAELARGGMGRILEAEDRRLGRPVAIKELLAPDFDRARRF